MVGISAPKRVLENDESEATLRKFEVAAGRHMETIEAAGEEEWSRKNVKKWLPPSSSRYGRRWRSDTRIWCYIRWCQSLLQPVVLNAYGYIEAAIGGRLVDTIGEQSLFEEAALPCFVDVTVHVNLKQAWGLLVRVAQLGGECLQARNARTLFRAKTFLCTVYSTVQESQNGN